MAMTFMQFLCRIQFGRKPLRKSMFASASGGNMRWEDNTSTASFGGNMKLPNLREVGASAALSGTAAALMLADGLITKEQMLIAFGALFVFSLISRIEPAAPEKKQWAFTKRDDDTH
jgi:hypothetical protein